MCVRNMVLFSWNNCLLDFLLMAKNALLPMDNTTISLCVVRCACVCVCVCECVCVCHHTTASKACHY